MRLGCALLCAGKSERFVSGDKLLSLFMGERLIERAISAIPREIFESVTAIAGPGEVAEICRSAGLDVVINAQPELSVSHSVKLAVSAMSEMDAILFLVADQPYLRQETVRGCAELFLSLRECIVAAGTKTRNGNPVVFPKRFFAELLCLPIGKGGSYVIANNSESLRVHDVADERELLDADTVEDLAGLIDMR